jgi:chromosome segregation ATPase
MQLVVAQVAAAAAVASEVSTRMTLEAAKQSAEDRATAAQSAAATAVEERDALATRLDLTEAEVEKLCAVVASADEAAEGAKTAATATEATARDAAQATTRENAALETKVADLERDLGTALVDLATAGCQFSQVTNQLQWSPRRRRGCATATPCCRRTLRVSRADAFLHHLTCRFLLCAF